MKARPQALSRKTKAAVDRRQNNRNVTAVHVRSPCAATTVLRSCCPNCRGPDHFALRPQKRGGLLGTGTGGGGGRGRKSEGSIADSARKRPERPWTVARTMEVLRRCPLSIAQRLVHCATAVSTAVLGQSHKDNVRCTAVEERLEAKGVQLSQTSSTSPLMISSGLT